VKTEEWLIIGAAAYFGLKFIFDEVEKAKQNIPGYNYLTGGEGLIPDVLQSAVPTEATLRELTGGFYPGSRWITQPGAMPWEGYWK
jgi:hypothetical protein